MQLLFVGDMRVYYEQLALFARNKRIFEDKLLTFQDKEFWCVSRNNVRRYEACLAAGGQHFDHLQ
jgi:hypothetical protein